MKSFWRIARLTTCGAAILVIGYREAPFSSPAYGQEKTAADQKTNESIDRVRKAAEQGDADAQFKLGVLYYKGQGVPQDHAEAARWYRKAADQGNANAQCYLGSLYAVGQGVTQDYAETLRWNRKAADQGNAECQETLGYMYDRGVGVPQDHGEAVRWFRKAAEQGNANAQCNLGVLYYQGKGLRQDYAEAARWYRKAADQGQANAQYNLGFLYYQGKGLRQDYAEAVRWYRKAADQGQPDAQNDLGVIYNTGHGVSQDYAEAARWYRKAADQGNASAQKNIGSMYDRGEGVPQDHGEAVRWFRKAADQAGQSSLSDDAIQKAIDSGRATKVQALWKSIEKKHAVRMNRQSFADTVGKTAIFLADRDLIALAASDAARRHRILSVDEVKQWSNLGATHVLLVAEAGGMYIANLPKWQAPAVHMTITVDGREIQPLSESATERSETRLFPSQTGVVSRSGNVVTYTPLYESALYDVARSRTWFSFDIPPDGARLTVTVISADGHEKHKDFDASKLK